VLTLLNVGFFVSVSFQDLAEIALKRKNSASPYAGEVFAKEAFDYMQNQPSYLLDVRTKAEWQFSGLADLKQVSAKLLCVEWLNYPDFVANPNFVQYVNNEIEAKDAVIFCLCKTGGRSHQAANKLTELGYANCFNITHGFEGDHNEAGQRGKVNGWKAEGLPWKQQ
jgi:rhodanese-related sulfurtransferase